MSELKPCPFCGGDARPTAHLEYSWFAPVCRTCGVRGPSVRIESGSTPQKLRELMDKADELWNNRVTANMERQTMSDAPSIEAAYAMGAKGSPAVEAERLAFEAWMSGHCWSLCAHWTGSEYLGSSEQGGNFCPHAMMTRKLWAAWRDRAALTANVKLTGPCAGERRLT